jgi:hypothetical protein
MDDSERDCVEGNIDNDQLSEYLVAQFFQLTPSEGATSAFDAVDACITELTATSVAS